MAVVASQLALEETVSEELEPKEEDEQVQEGGDEQSATECIARTG